MISNGMSSSGMSCQLQVNRLNYRHAGNTLIADVSFEILENGITGLLGLNGAGKSTLLRLLAGILPDNGSVSCRPGITSDWHPIGYMPERPAFYRELSVLENIRFAGQLNGISSSNIRAYADEAIELSGLQQRRRQLAGQLSKGFQQRLGLAMAIVHKPELLLLDEPSDGLDPQQVGETQQLLRTLANDCAIIISSHRLDEISRLCRRLLILHQGRLVHDLGMDESHDHKQVEALFMQVTGEQAG